VVKKKGKFENDKTKFENDMSPKFYTNMRPGLVGLSKFNITLHTQK
jgi:hypothetical protein